MKRFLFCICFSLSTLADAATLDSDGSVGDVQAKQHQAANGDTITIPSGEFTWSTSVKFRKNITLKGQGSGVTTVVANLKNPIVVMNRTSSRVTGIYFKQQGEGAIIGTQGQNFRIDNNILENAGRGFTKSAVLATGSSRIPHPTGVIDHNTIINGKVLVQGDLGLWAHKLWHEPSTIGNPDQTGVVYVEDNVFNKTGTAASDAMDADYGGRYVARYNTFNNCHIEIHPTRGNGRGAKSWEVYENTFNRNLSGSDFSAIWQRGATGVIYNNTITGDFNRPIVLDNWRSFSKVKTAIGNCDGTSNWDANTENGWPCRDQVGRGPDESLFRLPPYPPQASEPTYIWNNTHNGNQITPVIHNCGNAIKEGGSRADIVKDRDYKLNARPNYTAFTYPHPLVSGGGRSPRPAPTKTPTPTPTATPATATPTPRASARGWKAGCPPGLLNLA